MIPASAKETCTWRGAKLTGAAAAFLTIALHAPVGVAQQVCGEWTQVDPPAGATLAVTEVAAASETDAWAFAYYLGLVRWNGTSWNQFPIPNPYGDYPVVWIDQFGLVGTSHLFLAGRGDTGPFSNDQVLKIWDGASWSDWHSLTLEPNIAGAPRNGAAYAVVGAAIDDAWIVGTAAGAGTGGGSPMLTVHWDGSELIEVLTPGLGDRHNVLYDAVAIATNDVWAVGHYEKMFDPPIGFHGATYHWDGSDWSPIPNPTQALSSHHLYTVTAIASDDVWAAGADGNRPLFMHWDGADWKIVPAPATTGTIYEIAAIASDDVWAVDFAAQVPAIVKYYHWDGVAWSIVIPPAIPGATTINRHAGLAAVGDCDVWAVGSIDYGSGLGPFIERLQTGGGGVTAAPILDPSFAFLEVSPNPVRHSAEIRLTIPGDVASRAKIYDVRGQLVRSLLGESSARDRLSWDGRDTSGRSVPGGVYFLRVESGGGRILTRKLTVVR